MLVVARMQHRSIRGMSWVVRVSFHSGDVPVLPHLSSLPEGKGADIVFVFPCHSLLVPCTCVFSATPESLEKAQRITDQIDPSISLGT